MLFQTFLLSLISVAAAGDVFAHYMVQTLYPEHAQSDVAAAQSMGINAFVLNVGRPGEPWSKECVDRLFAAVQGSDFKLFFSMDVASTNDPYAFSEQLNKYLKHSNYYRAGPDKLPMLSTFANAPNWGPSQWTDFRKSLASDTYFIPVFDSPSPVPNYSNNPDAFWSTWSSALDGAFTWEASWPVSSNNHQNISSEHDFSLMRVAHRKEKAYMAGLSTVQYKHYAHDGVVDHWFRNGDIVMPERMTQLLSLPVNERPDFVQIQTWNDAGESHYIGTLRDEGLQNEQGLMFPYASQEGNPHEGWQVIFKSFTAAFQSGAQDASNMRAPPGSTGGFVVASMWHREFLTSSSCSGTDGKPGGAGAALDTVNWAVVINNDAPQGDYYVQVWSGGKLIAKDLLGRGLNYKSVGGVNLGEQFVQVVDAGGKPIIEGGKNTGGIKANPSGKICTYNYKVEELL